MLVSDRDNTLLEHPAGALGNGAGIGLFSGVNQGFFQCYYRDPLAGGRAFNTSDALEVTFQ